LENKLEEIEEEKLVEEVTEQPQSPLVRALQGG
jgi:hypothetical protein